MNHLTNGVLRRARKPHICDWCLRRIEVGEQYRYSFIVDGGDAWSWHECETCEPYVAEMMADDSWGDKPSGEGWTTSEFLEFMNETHPDVIEKWRANDEMPT